MFHKCSLEIRLTVTQTRWSKFGMMDCLIAITMLAFNVARAEYYDVYLLAGQSNAGGHGYVSREHSQFSPLGDDGLVEFNKASYLRPQQDTIFVHWRGGNPSASRPVLWDARSAGWIVLKAGYSLYSYNSTDPEQLGAEIANHPFGPEVSFAERIRESRPGRKVAIIKYTQGATSLGTDAAPGAWDPMTGRGYDINGYAIAGHCYAGFLQLVQCSLQQLIKNGHTYQIHGMLWHQGESDSSLSAPVYKDRLKAFITAIRTDLGMPELPFLIGELIETSYDNIRAVQQEAAAEIAHTAFISSAGLKSDSTKIHFDTLAQLDLGRRYAERILEFEAPLRKVEVSEPYKMEHVCCGH